MSDNEFKDIDHLLSSIPLSDLENLNPQMEFKCR
jgi:hypothetical protein